MTVLLASDLTDADLALLTRPEAPALRAGGLRMLARAAGVVAPRPLPVARSVRPLECVRLARYLGAPVGWPGISHDLPGALRAG